MENEFSYFVGLYISFAIVSFIALMGYLLYNSSVTNPELCERNNLTYEACNVFDKCVAKDHIRCVDYSEEGLRKEIWIRRWNKNE